jgi:hypothetical protein
VFFRSLIFLALLAGIISPAEVVISQSQQFVVHYEPGVAPVEKLPAGTIEVLPQLLVVSAERVKQAVIGELPALNTSRQQIHIAVVNSAGADSPVGVASVRFADAWRYEMAVPRVVEEARLVKGFIGVLLLEYANRGAERSAELPAWVTEGMAEQLLHSFGPKLVIDRAPNAWEASTRDMNLWTRETLRTNGSPSFEDVTTAAVPPHKSAAENLYLASAHLLVHTLLEMPNGRQRFATFLQLLPRTWNWQVAFMQAYGFQRMLDVEKWWSLTLIEFTTRDQRQAWSVETSARRLDELLQTRVEYRNGTNTLPELRLVDLKSVLQKSDSALEQQAIEEKISQLNYTTPYMAPQVGALAIAYKKTLETFLQRRNGSEVRTGLRSTPEAQRQELIDETIRRVSALDQKRRALAEPTVSSTR